MPVKTTASSTAFTADTMGPAGSGALRGIPERIGPYIILGLIGEGGMAQVFRAEHSTLHRVVALKVMEVRDQLHASRFLRECRAVASLDHANIVPVHDAGQDGDRLYLALRLMPGGDVRSLVDKTGPLPISRALRLAQDCAEGIAAIHAAGMVHRDIKPANLLLDADGSARLTDLGLVRDAGTPGPELTQHGNAVGTPAYMSPEQARGCADTDIRADIYSAGATLYTMLTGVAPFDGTSQLEVAAKVLYEDPIDLSTLRPDCQEALVAVVRTAMARDREARFQSPAALITALGEISSGEPSQALSRMRLQGRSPAEMAWRGERLSDLALHCIDIIDRNLYERTCDVRWWATEAALVDALSSPSDTTRDRAGARLSVILDHYTVYADLWLLDADGTVVVNGRWSRWPDAISSSHGATSWFKRTLATRNGAQYVVDEVAPAPLLDGRDVLTWSAAVRRGGQALGQPLGALAIMFDWQAQARAVVQGIRLPRDERRRTAVLILDAKSRILASSDPRWRTGDLHPLTTEGRGSGWYRSADGTMTGFALSPGYETYRGQGWYGVVVQEPE